MYFAKVQEDYYLKLGSAQSNATRGFTNISLFFGKKRSKVRISDIYHEFLCEKIIKCLTYFYILITIEKD
jgi:hypothetical protein